jgi:hypothetical protein
MVGSEKVYFGCSRQITECSWNGIASERGEYNVSSKVEAKRRNGDMERRLYRVLCTTVTSLDFILRDIIKVNCYS